jgi:hypothetical protein
MTLVCEGKLRKSQVECQSGEVTVLITTREFLSTELTDTFSDMIHATHSERIKGGFEFLPSVLQQNTSIYNKW